MNAVDMADQLGVGRLQFETDCQNLVQAVTSNSYDLAPLGNLFTQIKDKLGTQFIHSHTSVVRTPRM